MNKICLACAIQWQYICLFPMYFKFGVCMACPMYTDGTSVYFLCTFDVYGLLIHWYYICCFPMYLWCMTSAIHWKNIIMFIPYVLVRGVWSGPIHWTNSYTFPMYLWCMACTHTLKKHLHILYVLVVYGLPHTLKEQLFIADVIVVYGLPLKLSDSRPTSISLFPTELRTCGVWPVPYTEKISVHFLRTCVLGLFMKDYSWEIA